MSAECLDSYHKCQNVQRRFGQQELCLLDGRLVVHVGGAVEEGRDLGDVEHALLLDLLARHDEQEALEIIGSNLVEDHLDVELVVEAQRVVPILIKKGLVCYLFSSMQFDSCKHVCEV